MKTEPMEEDLELKKLNNFTGTEQYHNLWLYNSNVTDGVGYIMENGYFWLVTDFLSIVKTDKDFKNQEFLILKLKLIKGHKAEMVITNGNDKRLYTHKYRFTDAKRELTLFYTNNVLMLSGEY